MDVRLEVEDDFVAWRGRCSRHGWRELMNYTRILWALIAFTFTLDLYLYDVYILLIMNPDQWKMAFRDRCCS